MTISKEFLANFDLEYDKTRDSKNMNMVHRNVGRENMFHKLNSTEHLADNIRIS